MADLPGNFEDELRKLIPSSCDRLKEETFYQAGWQAAETSIDKRVTHQKHDRLQSVRTFAVGLSCGLLISAIGLINWQPTTASNFESITRQTSESEENISQETNTSVVNISADQSAVNIADNDVSLDQLQPPNVYAVEMFPWNWLFDRGMAEPVPPESQPLSSAARRYGSTVVAADSSLIRNNQGICPHSTVPEPVPLRSSPLTKAIVDELL